MKKQRLKLISTIQLLFVASLVLLTIVIVTFQITQSQQKFSQRSEKMRTEYVVQQKALIKLEVERLVKNINDQRAHAEQQIREVLKQRVYQAIAIAENIYQQNRPTESTTKIQKTIVDALRPLRVNQDTGYFFIYSNRDGKNILFADRPDQEGTVMLNVQDTQGQYVIKDMTAITAQSGEGFYTYHGTKPGSNSSNHKKIDFVKLFEPYNWTIGTGIYVDDFETHIKAKLLGKITNTHFGKNGYFFVSNWQGISLAHGAQPNLVGTDMWDTKDSKGNKTSQSLIAMAKTKSGGFVKYWWRKPDNKKESPKIAYVRGIPEWQWMIATGVYLDDIETEIASLQKVLQKELHKDIINTVLAAGITLILFLIVLQIISRRLLGDLSCMVTFFERAAAGDKEIDRSQVHFEEFYQMAGHANRLLYDKIVTQQNLHEEKERFKDIAEQLPIGIFETDLTMNITYTNRKILELFGYSLNDFSNGLNGIDMFIPEERDRLSRNIAKRLKVNDNKVNEYWALKKNGSTFPVIAYTNLIRKKETPIGFRGFVVDISENKRAKEEQLRLEKLESIGVLAGGIAHDFNNLLAGLFGNLEIAKIFLSDDHKSYKYLDNAGQSMENATNLTRQLLTFAKGGDPIKKTLSIGAIITEIAQFSLRGSKVKLQTEIASDLYFVDVDKGQISQVISNLVINAQQAMPDGGNVTIKAENIDTPAGKHEIQISIQDEGIGIAPQYLDKIFDPYFTTKQQGNGLGLASSYSIINKHKGRITVESTLSKGTKFTLHLPAVTAATAITPIEIQKEITDDSADTPASARILVMDDEETIRTVSGVMLEEMGHQVTYVVNGQEALEKYRNAIQNKSPYDIVISDLTIPGGMGGKKVAQEILKIDPQAKLIVSSGYSADTVMTNYRKYGFRGRVAKPYSFAELQRVVAQVLKVE